MSECEYLVKDEDRAWCKASEQEVVVDSPEFCVEFMGWRNVCIAYQRARAEAWRKVAQRFAKLCLPLKDAYADPEVSQTELTIKLMDAMPGLVQAIGQSDALEEAK